MLIVLLLFKLLIWYNLVGDKMKEKNILYVVIPCYNEEEVLQETTKKLKEKLKSLISEKKISKNSKVMYVNDGSRDATWSLIKKINAEEKLFTGISLSRNRGHQNALLAGLMVAREYADVVISMDADLQDDVDAIDETTAQGFYKFMHLMGVEIVFNHADYRLTSKRVLKDLETFKEVNLFLRGIFPLIGYKSDVVYYERSKRFAGESKYPLRKMLNFALDGITSFSVKPLRLILNLGVIIFIISILMLIYFLVIKIEGKAVQGWTFIVCSIWFISGLQMLSLGIIGEYIGKIYSETKERPRYIIAENLEEND